MKPFSGLTEADAAARLQAEGHNELPQPDRRTPFRIVLEVLREPMLALLLVGGIVYLVLGDLKEAIILVAFATMSIVITVVQETRTERVLEALRDLTSPRALVIRDGERKRIAGRDVVRGDLIVLSEGDRVPADAVLLRCTDLQADESTADRRIRAGAQGRLGRSRRGPIRSVREATTCRMVFSGSLVVRGSGLAEVTAIGAQSEIGKIGQSLATLETEPPRLQVQTRRVVRLFAVFGGGVSVLAVLLYGIMRGGWLDAVLAGIALGMSMLPEEFPVVLTVFMAMGAWRISLARVLTRRAAAIETLGSATVLCTDKTGTLTENRMTIVELRLTDGNVVPPAGRHGNAGAVPRLERVRPARQRARAVRPDGAGVPYPGARAADRGRVSASALEAGARLWSSARSPRRNPRLAIGRRPAGLPRRRQGRSRSDRRSLPAERGRARGADAIHRRDGLRRPARAGRGACPPCRAALAGVAARTWTSNSWGWSASPIHCAPASSRRSANAGPPASRLS